MGRTIYYRLALTPFAQALALAGDADGAAQVLAEAEASNVPMVQWEEGELTRGHAWIAVARGDIALVRFFGPDLWLDQREFVSLYQFALGTVTTRTVCTPEFVAFIEAVLAGGQDRSGLRAKLRLASDVHRAQMRQAKDGHLPLERLTALADEHDDVRQPFNEWVEACGGVAYFDVPVFWTRYGGATDERLVVMTSGLRLVPGVDRVGRFGISWPHPALCLHYFITGDRIDVLFHSDSQLHSQLPLIGEALGRAVAEVANLV